MLSLPFPVFAALVSASLIIVFALTLFASDLADWLRPTRRAATEVLRDLARWDDSGYPTNAAARELVRREQLATLDGRSRS